VNPDPYFGLRGERAINKRVWKMIPYEGFCWDEFEKRESNFYSLGKRDEMGNDFPLFPFVLPYFAPSFGRRKRYLPFGTKEILFFLIGC
jgi:hypothetical protein